MSQPCRGVCGLGGYDQAMSFASGSLSFRRFKVEGAVPGVVDQELLDRISEHALRPADVGHPPEIEYGFSGGRHVLDDQFSFDKNVFADCICFALRVDTNRVPAELKRAIETMEEEAVAAGNPSGFISKRQKKDVKETIRAKLDEELRSGKFRRSKLTPILWDLPARIIYSPASGGAQDKLLEIFDRTLNCTLTPLTAGSLAQSILQSNGRRRDYEDARPTRFVTGPDGEGQHPEYPWTAKGPQPKDFFGNEFAMWLWHESESRDGTLTTEAAGEVSIFIDKSLDLDCAYGQTGRDLFRATGPGRMPEAREGLRSGKVPRRLGMVMDAFKQQYSLAFNAETFGFSSVRLPEVEEAETPRVLFEERIGLLRDLCRAADAMYEAFLKVRCSSAWEGQVAGIRRWTLKSPKPVAAVA
ncbi:MAG TPA: hypothetical protein VMD30_05675 [Tepidisphaeraceae bacterium]|nr:hypothetical protein [Tepidisphaeraceae bacterium]